MGYDISGGTFQIERLMSDVIDYWIFDMRRVTRGTLSISNVNQCTVFISLKEYLYIGF